MQLGYAISKILSNTIIDGITSKTIYLFASLSSKEVSDCPAGNANGKSVTGEDVSERGEILVVGDDGAEVWVGDEAQRTVAIVAAADG